ncbi:MAG: hypothetical protein ACJ754_00745 [Pyrinomonadaceae bacterium]
MSGQNATAEMRHLRSRVGQLIVPMTHPGPVRVSEQMATCETRHLGPECVRPVRSNVGQLTAVSNWHGGLSTVGGQATFDCDWQRTLIDWQGELAFVWQGNSCVMQMTGSVGQTFTCDGQKESRVAQLSNSDGQLKPVPMGPPPPPTPPTPPGRAAKNACGPT